VLASQSKLVVKPDMLFGQRGKHDLVGLNLSYDEAEAFVKARMGKQVRVRGAQECQWGWLVGGLQSWGHLGLRLV
jgi:succinyl-CoA synthetase beta subunit